MEYIVNRPIYELCTGAGRIPGSSRFVWWLYQDLKQEEEGGGASERAEREVG